MLHVHLVFFTEYRRDVLSDLAIRDLQRIFAKVCTDIEAELIECDGEDDHVHLLVHSPPKLALFKRVNGFKGVSSRLLRETRPEVAGRYFKGVLWSPSYFVANCGGPPLSYLRSMSSHKGERPGAALAFLPTMKDGGSSEVRDERRTDDHRCRG